MDSTTSFYAQDEADLNAFAQAFAPQPSKSRSKPWERAPVSAHATRLQGHKIWKRAGLRSGSSQHASDTAQIELEREGAGARKRARVVGGKENILNATWAEVKDGKDVLLLAGSPVKKGRMSMGVDKSDALVVPRKRTNANHLITPKRRAKRIPLANVAPGSGSSLKTQTPEKYETSKRAPLMEFVPPSESPVNTTQPLNNVETPKKQSLDTVENQAHVIMRGAATEKPAQRRKSMRKSLRRLTADCTNFAITFTGSTFDDTIPQAPTELVRNVEEHERQGTPSPVTPEADKVALDILQQKSYSLQKESNRKQSEDESRPWKSVRTTKFTDVDGQKDAGRSWWAAQMDEIGYCSSRSRAVKDDVPAINNEAASAKSIDEGAQMLIITSMTPVKEAPSRKSRRTPRSSYKSKTPWRESSKGTRSADAFIVESETMPIVKDDQSFEIFSAGTTANQQEVKPFEDIQPFADIAKIQKQEEARTKSTESMAQFRNGFSDDCIVSPPLVDFTRGASLESEEELIQTPIEPYEKHDQLRIDDGTQLVPTTQNQEVEGELLVVNRSEVFEASAVEQAPPESENSGTGEVTQEENSLTKDRDSVDTADSVTQTALDETKPCMNKCQSFAENLGKLAEPQEASTKLEQDDNSGTVDVADEIAVKQKEDDLEEFEIITLPKLTTTSTNVQRDATPESEELKESSTPDPTTNELVEVISEHATANKYDEDDTDLLRNFLTRVKANKEAKANATSSTKRKRSFPNSPMKLPLESGDDTLTFSPNAFKDEFEIPAPAQSPSKRRKHNEAIAAEEDLTDTYSVRRSGRTRLPVVKASTIPAPNFIRLGRLGQDDTTTLTFRRNEEKNLATLTRVNTRKNKGMACSAQDTILILEEEEKNPARRHQALKQKFDAKTQNSSKKKSVVWAEEIAEYSDGKKPESKQRVVDAEKEKVEEKEKKSALPVKVVTIGAPTGVEEKKSKSVKVGVRSSRIAMGMTATGTPAPKKRSKSVRT